MHAGQIHVHYAPSSVGALMDPMFLRAAMCDADGIRREEAASTKLKWLKWKAAIRTWREGTARRQLQT